MPEFMLKPIYEVKPLENGPLVVQQKNTFKKCRRFFNISKKSDIFKFSSSTPEISSSGKKAGNKNEYLSGTL